MAGVADLLRRADEAVAQGDLEAANALLAEAAEQSTTPEIWLRLAGLRRAARQPRQALAYVYRALEIAPLDFTALTMRASLLSALDDPQAGEAWGNAIAQRPPGDLPPALTAALNRGEQEHEAWQTAREDGMRLAMATAEQEADPDARVRIARFRDNVLRKTRPYHCEPTHFHFPGLIEREFHPRSSFPWLAGLEAATPEITAELQAVMDAERNALVPYIQYAAHEPLDQWRPLNHNLDWTAIHLLQNGRTIDVNARHCPQTLALIAGYDQPSIAGASPNAMFSLLAPNTQIPAHVGVSNARLVCHLPLIVPPGCWFRVGSETREWQVGEAFVFDDTIEHEAMNPTDELRVVLIFDLWHPGLGAAERAAVRALIESEGEGPAGGL